MEWVILTLTTFQFYPGQVRLVTSPHSVLKTGFIQVQSCLGSEEVEICATVRASPANWHCIVLSPMMAICLLLTL